jgi:hypothetical protein
MERKKVMKKQRRNKEKRLVGRSTYAFQTPPSCLNLKKKLID